MVKKLFYTNTVVLLISLMGLSNYAQMTINKPAITATEICAYPGFNNFSLSFGFVTPSLDPSNVFTLQLSDASGSFASPVQLIVLTSSFTTSVGSMSFQIPTNLNGMNYKIRVKSSVPVATSPSSDPFKAIYKAFEQSFNINNQISSQSFCENSTYNLSIDSGINSPLNFTQLTYNWYRNNVLIPGQNGSILPVTQVGIYYCKVFYDYCPTDSQSNAVTMTQVPAQVLTITSPNTLLCGTANILLSSNLSPTGNIYEWYRDNILIPNSNTSNYSASLPGAYFVKITNNACITTSNIILLTTPNFNLALDTGPNLTIIPGQNITINATTNAASPIFKWYKDTVLQSSTSSSLVTNLAGTYKLIVKEGTGCQAEKEISTVISYPTSYSLIFNPITPYVDCVSNTVTLGITSFTANNTINVFSSLATVIYKIYKNGVLYTGANTNTVSLLNFSDNGTYTITATLADGTVVTSNPVVVKLKFDPNVILTTTSPYICNANPSIVITPSILNSLYVYNWYKVGNSTSLSSAQTYSTSVEGDYNLKLSYLGCEVTSNTITIKKADVGLLLTDYETDITINEGQSITITASGADSYTWSVVGQPNVTTPTFVVNQTGIISLIGTFGTCTVEKIFTITKSNNISNLFIPNAITPNNDSSNDTWIIPEKFAYKEDIEVVIFSSRQEIVFKSNNYLQNWPITQIEANSVYYYKIMKDSSVIEKGTISILK